MAIISISIVIIMMDLVSFYYLITIEAIVLVVTCGRCLV